MIAYVNITLQGIVYFTIHCAGDSDAIEWYSSELLGAPEEKTFSVVYSKLSSEWKQQDDIIKPFYDRRSYDIGAIWTFDIDNDLLHLDKKDCSLSVSLSLVRQRPITISDFHPCQGSPIRATDAINESLTVRQCTLRLQNMNLQQLQRQKAFTARLLADFAFQWRHIILGQYNNITFRRLAYAVIRIITMDFSVKEITLPRKVKFRIYVELHDLPEWDFANENILRIGDTSIVMCQNAQHALDLIHEDFGKLARLCPGQNEKTFTYLVLSIRDVVVYQINQKYTTCTKTCRFFDGTNPPSDDAIELLLQAAQSDISISPPQRLFLRKLPLELQDMILNEASAGLIESARIGCLLGIGSAFTWKCGNRAIEREEVHRNRTPRCPVGSNIWLGNHFSGVAYK